jgi:hypothetical protein
MGWNDERECAVPTATLMNTATFYCPLCRVINSRSQSSIEIYYYSPTQCALAAL